MTWGTSVNTRKRIVLSLLLGLLAAVALFSWRKGVERRVGVHELDEVLVATQAMPAGMSLATDLIRVERLPRRYLHPQTIAAQHLPLMAGRKTTTVLREGQPLEWRDLEEEDPLSHHISGRIPPGQRVVALTELGGVSQLLHPGDRVDLVWIHMVGDRREAHTLLQSVLVLGTAEQERGRSQHPVSVVVSPQEAEKLLLALDRGEVTATLRATGDVERVQLEDVNLEVIAAAPPPTPRSPEAQIIDLMKGISHVR